MIVALACKQAVAACALDDALVHKALSALGRGQADESLVSGVAELAARLDDAYFDAKERGDDSWLGLFHQARAAAAVAYGLAAGDAETAADAVYEAAHATEDPSAIYGAITG